jgi:hypothetical protein
MIDPQRRRCEEQETYTEGAIMALTFDANTVMEQLENAPHGLSQPRRVTLELLKGQSAWNPASTKPERSIYGPATVRYSEYTDGGIEAVVTEH